MKSGLGMSFPALHEVFSTWNRGKLDLYLIRITRDIMAFLDDDGAPLVEKILDPPDRRVQGDGR